MSETWINIDAESSAIRLLLKHVSASRGVALGQLTASVEIAARKPVASEIPVWIEGSVSVRNLGQATGYLARLHGTNQPITLPELGGTRDITFTADVANLQLQVIEEHRIGPVALTFDLSGYCLVDRIPKQFWGNQLEHEISQSSWIQLLEQIGYRRVLLFEIDSPNAQTSPAQALALRYFADAQRHFLEHSWRNTVESLRQCLAALVGKQPDEEATEEDVQMALKEVRKQAASDTVGYAERYEPIRAAIKFLCDLGAHPAVDDTGKQQAHSALLMVAGLLLGMVERPGA